VVTLRWLDRPIETREGETVLMALLRSGVHVPYYCHVGSCKTCVVRVLRGEAPPEAQIDLMQGQLERGCFLACSSIPTHDLDLGPDA
jgi:ferredoxin